MKKTLIIAIAALSMIACKKSGVVYKFNYTTPNDHFYVATNYFFRDYRDDKEAVQWYKETDAWKDISTKCDTFWVEYWGTYDEWKSIGH